MAEERKEMVKVMNEIMEGWQEMDGKDKAVCVVDKHVKMDGYEGKWRNYIDSSDCTDWGRINTEDITQPEHIHI